LRLCAINKSPVKNRRKKNLGALAPDGYRDCANQEKQQKPRLCDLCKRLHRTKTLHLCGKIAPIAQNTKREKKTFKPKKRQTSDLEKRLKLYKEKACKCK
jgi:hypothetical protein